MHVISVYETKVSTETFSSMSEFVTATTDFSNAQSGSSTFRGTQEQLDSRSVRTASKSVSMSGGFPGMS